MVAGTLFAGCSTGLVRHEFGGSETTPATAQKIPHVSLHRKPLTMGYSDT